MPLQHAEKSVAPLCCETPSIVNSIRNTASGMTPRFSLQNTAAPSFLWPGKVAENCARLASMVPEVGLLFFETRPCLEYTRHDLPLSLAESGLRYHVHLPLDLPWADGAEAVWAAVRGLLAKCAFLRPWAAVLHPPTGRVCPQQKNGVTSPLALEHLRRFLSLWAGEKPAPKLLLENIRGEDLTAAWPLIRPFNAGICLDLGHLLAFGQKTDKIPGLWPHVGMVHLSAPGPAGEHRSLKFLDPRGRERLRHILARVGPDCVLMLEVFNVEDFLDSLSALREWGMLRK